MSTVHGEASWEYFNGHPFKIKSRLNIKTQQKQSTKNQPTKNQPTKISSFECMSIINFAIGIKPPLKLIIRTF